MNWPLGELKALATKATRGAGFSWSLSEETGYAAQWLESHGVTGISHLANYLRWVEANGLLVAPVDMLDGTPDAQALKCPIALGCLITDTKAVTSDASIRVSQPALFLPFLGWAAGHQAIVCKINDTAVAVCANGVDQEALKLPELSLAEASLSWRLQEAGAVPKCLTGSRASDDRASIHTLLRLADKTYAPATDASRLAGAGAGTTDND
ncbi:MAG: DUF3726 domain-containing protein [Granulosicoccaceae bacterium]